MQSKKRRKIFIRCQNRVLFLWYNINNTDWYTDRFIPHNKKKQQPKKDRYAFYRQRIPSQLSDFMHLLKKMNDQSEHWLFLHSSHYYPSHAAYTAPSLSFGVSKRQRSSAWKFAYKYVHEKILDEESFLSKILLFITSPYEAMLLKLRYLNNRDV